MKKLPYQEGTWFALPLRSGGFAVGLVARMRPTGKIILGYIFGPRRRAMPSLQETAALKPDHSLFCARMGDLALIQGSWPIIGESPRWNREDWPIPKFYRRDDLTGDTWEISYLEDNPSQIIKEALIDNTGHGFPATLYGSGAVELLATKKLDG